VRVRVAFDFAFHGSSSAEVEPEVIRSGIQHQNIAALLSARAIVHISRTGAARERMLGGPPCVANVWSG